MLEVTRCLRSSGRLCYTVAPKERGSKQTSCKEYWKRSAHKSVIA